MKPLVSVIIPLFNGERYIAQTIESALSQTYPNIEIIVVDDGSTDSGPDIVQDYPVTLVHKENGGISSARNIGIKTAKAEFIALLDQDDLFMPRKIERQVKYLTEHPECSLVFTPVIGFDLERGIRKVFAGHVGRRVEGDIFTDIYKSNYITPCSTLIRQEILAKTGLFDEALSICEDHDLFIRIAFHGLVGFIDEPLSEYRWHEQNTSRIWSTRLPFIEYELYRTYLPWLKEKTRWWWWIYNGQRAKALRNMGIVALGENNIHDARRWLLASLCRVPWRYKTLRNMMKTLRATSGSFKG